MDDENDNVRWIWDRGIGDPFRDELTIEVARQTAAELASYARRLEAKIRRSEQPTPQERLIRIGEVVDIAGICDTQIYDLIRAEKFPRQIKIGRASRWSLTEVLGWVDEQIMAFRKSDA